MLAVSARCLLHDRQKHSFMTRGISFSSSTPPAGWSPAGKGDCTSSLTSGVCRDIFGPTRCHPPDLQPISVASAGRESPAEARCPIIGPQKDDNNFPRVDYTRLEEESRCVKVTTRKWTDCLIDVVPQDEEGYKTRTICPSGRLSIVLLSSPEIVAKRHQNGCLPTEEARVHQIRPQVQKNPQRLGAPPRRVLLRGARNLVNLPTATSTPTHHPRTNIDCDVTPVNRRTWNAFTIFGFWFSDALNAQAWMQPAAILALGLTWREAIIAAIFGSLTCCVPLVLNGSVGARLHVPFPIAMRASWGYYASRFPVVVRAVTALFWHAIQTYTGSTAMTQMIRAIWPSYLDIPNHIPQHIGLTSQQMLSHFIFWTVQFPFLMIPPHKLKWLFVFKTVLVLVSSVAVVISMTMKAGGTGDIWNLPYGVSGSARRWLILSCVSSYTGSWYVPHILSAFRHADVNSPGQLWLPTSPTSRAT